MNTEHIEFSLVLLTYNREKYLKQQLPELNELKNCEIVIVDNGSDDNYAQRLACEFEKTTVVQLDKNYGAVGRNFGIEKAKGRFIITLDDDVWGITDEHLDNIKSFFERRPRVYAICFKVLDEKGGGITNWCHHCDPAMFGDISFDTYEISEGAVAFRKETFAEIGLYPLEFFISHEGLDLSLRILKAEREIVYLPVVEVTHAHATEGRKSWRRYYFDTRNLIWIAYRHYNARLLLSRFPLQILAMLIYSIRDGFARYYFKAVFDAISGIKNHGWTRQGLSPGAYNTIKRIDINKPSLIFYIKKRVFKRGIKI